ncbi:MAG TPA: nucleotide pyrophosphohydrolase [Desulfobacteraceae bacterium]|nr:nucleotide pyrophosphohydrolase [Desulfobacteraceae bacterium]
MSSEQTGDKGFSRLYEIILRLRGQDGCPWDIRQSPESIRRYLLEETTELAEAIDRRNQDDIREEIGDLMYILTMLIRMHEERGMFTCEDVLAGIAEKMIRRHPHVFSGLKTGSESEMRQQWQAIKEQEKNSRT